MQPFFYMFLPYIRCMLLYNITLIIEMDSENDVISRVKDTLWGEKLPSTDFLPRLLKMQDSQHEGSTYSLQLQVESESDMLRFREHHLRGLQSNLEIDFPGKVLYFESLMEYIIEMLT